MGHGDRLVCNAVDMWSCHLHFLCQDFLEVLLHHVATIALLLACYAISMVKMGTLIVLLHDVSDVPLEV